MKEPSIYILRKYLNALTKVKKKYVTAEMLSKVLGVYPEIITENLAFFEPMIMMDYEYNLMELVPMIKEHIHNKEAAKIKARQERAKLREAAKPKDKAAKEKLPKVKYASIQDFVYKKMTFGGMFDKSAKLEEDDLKALKHLVILELNKKK